MHRNGKSSHYVMSRHDVIWSFIQCIMCYTLSSVFNVCEGIKKNHLERKTKKHV